MPESEHRGCNEDLTWAAWVAIDTEVIEIYPDPVALFGDSEGFHDTLKEGRPVLECVCRPELRYWKSWTVYFHKSLHNCFKLPEELVLPTGEVMVTADFMALLNNKNQG